MLLSLWVFSLLSICSAFYLPGVGPTEYAEGDPISLLVNRLTPTMHNMENGGQKDSLSSKLYSYDYYYPKLRFCVPEGGPVKQLESLGSIIFGDRIFSSPFHLEMLKPKECEVLCTTQYSRTDANFVRSVIKGGYNHNWLVDGLPAARHVREKSTHSDFYSSGFPMGTVEGSDPVLYNHFVIHVEYHPRKSGTYRVVGVVVEGHSYERSKADLEKKPEEICDPKKTAVTLKGKNVNDVIFTYSVTFDKSATAWATRWDKYLHVYDPKIQWVSLINFSLIVLVLASVMSHILYTALKNDITKYNEVDLDDDVTFESGWKLISGDVFRAPKNRMLLSVLVGSGTQLLCMTFVTIVFAMFGLLSPSNRGALSTSMFIFFILFSFIASYVSGYIYRFFGGENWKINMLLTPALVPGLVFGVFIFMNFLLISLNSSGAIPFGTMMAILALWFGISVPLAVAGSILQSKRSLISVPVRTNQIPRQIPKQIWYLRTVPATAMCGIFPFGSIAVELYFIYSSIWFNKIFYMFGFLFFCFLLMVIITILVSILAIYYTLCGENYKWQWKSLFVGGGCGAYVFIHSLFFLKNEGMRGFVSFCLFTGYSFVISSMIFLLCSSVGFLSCLFFVRGIYSQIKID